MQEGEVRATGDATSRARAIAFYLPQFHPIPENDAWWGAGFTEWRNVTKAVPLFHGHHQPRLPGELGFYDLRLPEVRAQQAELAAAHGIEAFCYWHYWFAGKRLLERPFQEVLATGEPRLPFCLAWANQSWTGVWHGAPDRMLAEQTYPGRADHERHFDALLPAFTDPRYLTVDGRPLFAVYRPKDIPDVRAFLDIWRERAHRCGLPGLFMVALRQSHYVPEDPFDAFVPATPDRCFDLNRVIPVDRGRLWLARAARSSLRRTSSTLYETLVGGSDWLRPRSFRYRDVIDAARRLPDGPDHLPCIFPGWDNTPRSGRSGSVVVGETPELFTQHARDAIGKIAGREPQRRLLFIKAWNEWAEGNYLEPDLVHGRAFLEALRDVLREAPAAAPKVADSAPVSVVA